MSGMAQGVISRMAKCRLGEWEWEEVTHDLWMSWVAHGKSEHKKYGNSSV